MREARHVDVLAADAEVVLQRVADTAAAGTRRTCTRSCSQRYRPMTSDAVADAVRMLVGLRVQQDARRVDGRRAHDDDLAETPCAPCPSAIEVLHALRQPVLVHEHAPTTAFDRISSLPVFSAAGSRWSAEQKKDAVSQPGAAVAAVMAGGEAVAAASSRLARRPCTIGMSRDSNACFSSRSPHRGAGGGMQELAARQRVRIVVAAADADQLLDLVVVRRDVLVVRSATGSPSRPSPAP